jgi:hypothetical protein
VPTEPLGPGEELVITDEEIWPHITIQTIEKRPKQK